MADTPPEIFNRALLAARRRRASAHFANASFLHEQVALDIVDRLETIKRQFDDALFIGPGSQLIAQNLTQACGVANATVLDPLLDPAIVPQNGLPAQPPAQSLCLLVSMMDLHVHNDPAGFMIACRAMLKADGLFIAAIPAEKTLQELRNCLYQAETEILGGVSARVIPFGAIRDLGGLLQRAGFALPVADVFDIPVTYRNPMKLLQDLRQMGETSVLADRPAHLSRTVLTRAMTLYQERFGTREGVPATFQIAMLTGWTPHASQQQPLKPGSGKMHLEEAIKRNAEPKS